MKTFIKKSFIVFIFVITALMFFGEIIHVGDKTYNIVNQQILYDLDYPQTQLNNHSLREVFEEGNLILNGDFSDGTNNWTTDVGNNLSTIDEYGSNSMLVVNTTGNDFLNIYQYKTANSTHNFYVTLNVFNNVGNNMDLEVYSIPYDLHLSTSLLYNGLFNHYSTIFTKNNDNSVIIVFTGIDRLTTQSGSVSFKNIKLIDLTILGISSFTITQMDYWYNIYQTLKAVES